MHATTGDRLLMHSNSVGVHDRIGTVVEVRGNNGEPPYLVRFADGRETLVYPGPDCVIKPGGSR